MDKLTVKEFNSTTGEEVVRDMTEEEVTQYQIDKANREAEKADQIAKAEAKASLLDRLGLTADEAALLLG
jgi:DTW domain-containing protein YfiP